MQGVISDIRTRLSLSQEELAKLIGTSFASVNRWENGHSVPGKAAQIRLYDICREKKVDLGEIIQNKINRSVLSAESDSDRVILYHGSKSGIKGEIAPISREKCDFGKGFYMGTDPKQPLTLISDFDDSHFYILSLNLKTLRVLDISPDLEWAMFVAYNRGRMHAARGTKLFERFAGMGKDYDIIKGSIADDRMFYVLDNFFLGNITDVALVKSLSALKLGEQYVAVTEKACSHIKTEAEISLSYLERMYLRDESGANRARGIEFANQICRDYRREGLFFDEILSKAKESEQ